MSCGEVTGNLLMAIAVINMLIPVSNDQDCNVPLQHWVMVIWLFLISKWFAKQERREFSIWKFYCGKFMSNPFICGWLIKGCVLVSRAEGTGCYRHYSKGMVIMLIVLSFLIISFFVIGTILLVALLLQRIAYLLMVKIYGAERVDRMFLFRNDILRIMARNRGPVVLTVSQIETLKKKVEKKVSPQDLANSRFIEDPCPICLEHFQLEEAYIPLMCKHNFHTACLGTWLEKKNTCPMCAAEVKVEDFKSQPSEITTSIEPLDESHHDVQLTQTN